MTNPSSEVLERLDMFTTCGCGDDDWPLLRHDTQRYIERLSAELERVKAERDLLLQRPLDMAKLDSEDDGVAEQMVTYYWWHQAQEARAEVAALTLPPTNNERSQ